MYEVLPEVTVDIPGDAFIMGSVYRRVWKRYDKVRQSVNVDTTAQETARWLKVPHSRLRGAQYLHNGKLHV